MILIFLRPLHFSIEHNNYAYNVRICSYPGDYEVDSPKVSIAQTIVENAFGVISVIFMYFENISVLNQRKPSRVYNICFALRILRNRWHNMLIWFQ